MIKSYTNLGQSKRLAEILPHKSADGTWEKVSICGAKVDIPEDMQYRHKEIPFSFFSGIGVPCWSLAALLDYLLVNQGVIVKSLDKQWEVDCIVHVEYSKELVDACYEMIIELHEQKFL